MPSDPNRSALKNLAADVTEPRSCCELSSRFDPLCVLGWATSWMSPYRKSFMGTNVHDLWATTNQRWWGFVVDLSPKFRYFSSMVPFRTVSVLGIVVVDWSRGWVTNYVRILIFFLICRRSRSLGTGRFSQDVSQPETSEGTTGLIVRLGEMLSPRVN